MLYAANNCHWHYVLQYCATWFWRGIWCRGLHAYRMLVMDRNRGTKSNPFSAAERIQIAGRLKILRGSLRNGHGLSQAEMAEMADTTHSHYSKCESGHNTFSGRFLERVAQRTGTSADWLVSGKGPMWGTIGDEAPDPDGKAAKRTGLDFGTLVRRVLDASRDPEVVSAVEAVCRATGCTREEAMSMVVSRRLAGNDPVFGAANGLP